MIQAVLVALIAAIGGMGSAMLANRRARPRLEEAWQQQVRASTEKVANEYRGIYGRQIAYLEGQIEARDRTHVEQLAAKDKEIRRLNRLNNQRRGGADE